MNSTFIIWAAPAYISYVLFQCRKPLKQRAGWDLIAHLAVFGLLNFFTATIVTRIILLVPEATPLVSIWKGLFPGDNSGRLLVSLVLSPFIGVGVAKWFFGGVTKILDDLLKESFGTNFRSVAHEDVFYRRVRELVTKQVMLTLDNNKVYVGILVDISDDPDIEQKFIRLRPGISGFRNSDDGKITFNVDYYSTQKEISTAEPLDTDLMIALSRIVTLSPFDGDLHAKFVGNGTARVQ